jgi:hypothetical protein
LTHLVDLEPLVDARRVVHVGAREGRYLVSFAHLLMAHRAGMHLLVALPLALPAGRDGADLRLGRPVLGRSLGHGLPQIQDELTVRRRDAKHPGVLHEELLHTMRPSGTLPRRAALLTSRRLLYRTGRRRRSGLHHLDAILLLLLAGSNALAPQKDRKSHTASP